MVRKRNLYLKWRENLNSGTNKKIAQLSSVWFGLVICEIILHRQVIVKIYEKL